MSFLHGDISITTILMLDPPVTMKPFEARVIEQLVMRLSLWMRTSWPGMPTR